MLFRSIIGPGIERELGKLAVELHPGDLNVVDGTGQQEARQGMDFEVLG